MMCWIRQWRLKNKEERELSEELHAHLQIEERQRLEAGERPDEAARAARQAFGNATQIQEDVRETWGWAGFERSLEDLRYGLRMMRKTPAWTSVICATLALGIGLSTAIFSIVYTVLLQSLPYPDADIIVAMWPRCGCIGERMRRSSRTSRS
jgi:hypothetical protein